MKINNNFHRDCVKLASFPITTAEIIFLNYCINHKSTLSGKHHVVFALLIKSN